MGKGPGALHRISCIAFLSQLFLAVALCQGAAFCQMDHIEAAARLLSGGELPQAEAEARQALNGTKTRPLALAMLGTIRLQQQKYAESTTLLTQALALNPHLVGARTTLANVYLLRGNTVLARRNFQQVLRLDPGNSNARFGLAKLEAAAGKYRESLAAAQPIMPQLAASEDGILLLATDYGAQGNKDELRSLFQNWQRLPAPSGDSTLEFADLLAAAGMREQAMQLLRGEDAKVQSHPSAAMAWKVARSQLAAGDPAGAQRNFQLAISLSPECAACELGLAQVAEQQGNGEKALAHLIKARQLRPEDPEILFEFGKVCLERNLLEDALPALTKAAALKPERQNYVYVLASAQVAKGHLAEAATLLAGLLQKHPGDAILNYAVGTVYYLQGKYPQAEAALKKSVQAQPNQIGGFYYLGKLYEALGQEEEAVKTFRDLLEKHPDHAPANVELGTILLRQHQYEEARRDLERAIQSDPKSVEAHYQLGLLLRRLGRSAESQQELAESRKLETERRSQTDVRLRLLQPE